MLKHMKFLSDSMGTHNVVPTYSKRVVHLMSIVCNVSYTLVRHQQSFEIIGHLYESITHLIKQHPQHLQATLATATTGRRGREASTGCCKYKRIWKKQKQAHGWSKVTCCKSFICGGSIMLQDIQDNRANEDA